MTAIETIPDEISLKTLIPKKQTIYVFEKHLDYYRTYEDKIHYISIYKSYDNDEHDFIIKYRLTNFNFEIDDIIDNEIKFSGRSCERIFLDEESAYQAYNHAVKHFIELHPLK